MVVGTRHKYNLYKTLTTTNPTFEMDRAYSTKIEVTRFNPGLKSGAVKSVIRKRIFGTVHICVSEGRGRGMGQNQPRKIFFLPSFEIENHCLKSCTFMPIRALRRLRFTSLL